MNQNIIHNFLHEYDFEVEEVFSPHIKDIIHNFNKNLKRENGNNVIYNNEKLRLIVQSKYYKIIKSYYTTSPPIFPTVLYTYVQNSEKYIHYWHNHAYTATISAVFYLNIPSKGGSIKFFIDGVEHNYYPKPNKILLFPSWLYHIPTPQEDTEERICINIEFACETRPIVNKKLEVLGQLQHIRW